MSTFAGKLQEFSNISIDRFDNENLNSDLFFLSHCHMDHMVGLSNPNGIPGPLHLSAISSVIIQKQFPHIKDLVVLKENEPAPIKYTDVHGVTQFVTVTTVPAFHCPGSVMFLFEKDHIKVLYTGDFRLSKRYLQKMKSLRSIIGSIDTIYVDSTFLHTDYENFPGQFHSAITICDIIREWLSKSSKNVISLKMPARYGYELLYMKIGKLLKLKIHINEDDLAKYRHIPELDNIFTNDPQKSRIHACFDYFNKNGKYLTCHPELDPALIRVIKPTAMIWREWKESLEIVKHEVNEIVRVCYSNHCSMSEIRDFLIYLQPKNVQLNVVPTDTFRKQKMLDAVSGIVGKYRSTNCRQDKIHLCDWDNLSKISKINFNFSKSIKDTKEPLSCPPKRKRN